MKIFTRKLTLLFTLFALGFAGALGIGLLHKPQDPLSVQAAEGQMVKMTLKGLENKEYELDVYYDGNYYYLADYLRNIVIFNGSDIEDFASYGNNFKLYASRNGEFTDQTAVTLYYNCVQVYDAYTEENIGVELKGLNNNADDILNNATENGEVTVYAIAHLNNGANRYNASFSPQWNKDETAISHGFMYVGDGNPEGTDTQGNYYHFYQQARSLDTIGHEYQHGVTRSVWGYSPSTSGDYGAINEATSDIFGMLIENVEENKNASSPVPLRDESWDNGTKATYDGTPLYSMRTKSPYYRFDLTERTICEHGEEGHNNSCDYGYVHYNSTILTNAQYLAWKRAPQAFTRQKIGKLWYETIHHITPESTLEDFALESLRAAQKLDFEEEAIETLYGVYTAKGFPLCKVTFEGADGKVYHTEYVQKGESAAAPSKQPVKESTVQYSYSFKGWKGDLENVTEDITVTPEFEETLRQYSVSFYLESGELYKEETLPYGALTLPTLPEGFEAWYLDAELTKPAENAKVEGDMKLYAKAAPVKDDGADLGLILGISIPVAVLVVAGVAVLIVILKKRHA